MTHRLLQKIAGADDTRAGDATELKWELDEDLGHCLCLFRMISSGASWDDRGSSIWGCLSLFGSVVKP